MLEERAETEPACCAGEPAGSCRHHIQATMADGRMTVAGQSARPGPDLYVASVDLP